MALKRIKDFTVTATRPNRDDYIELDGATGNSRKLLAQSFDDLRNALSRPRGGVSFDANETRE
jgi:hypothetical protein